ncbi:MAG TPA: hypothetical protein VM370_13840 [Candidatus Thermoplasmatota archaeon]|nr:hypothetical protein [Candidatus Thermoplasmatota archaeon]
MRPVVLLLVLALLPLWSATADGALVGVPAVLAGGASAAAAAPQFQHFDCAGPGAAQTAGAHATHTERVGGFVIDEARSLQANVVTSAIVGAGICPTTTSGPILREFFSGHYALSAVCRGSINDGAVLFAYDLDAIAGRVVAQSFAGGSCIGAPASGFALDVTVGLSPSTTLAGALPATGGVSATIKQ